MAVRYSLSSCLLLVCVALLGVPVFAQNDALGAYALTMRASSAELARSYPRSNLRISCKIKYKKPGTIFDTVGINAAPVGSFNMSISPDGHVNLMVFDPTQKSELRADNGWHVLTSTSTIPPNTDGAVQIDVKDKETTLSVNGKVEKTLPLAVKLSGKTIYVGDNPEDDAWGESYNIHPAMIGTVTVDFFGEIKDVPPAPVAPAATDKGPLTDSPAAIDAGVKKVEGAFRAGKTEDVLKLTCPAFLSRYKPIFEAHQDQLSRLADILATRKLVAAVGARAEYEVKSNNRTLTIVFEKVDGVWMLSAL